MFGTCVAETILASVHVRTPRKAGHMNASDQIKLSRNILRVRGRPHMGSQERICRLALRLIVEESVLYIRGPVQRRCGRLQLHDRFSLFH